MPELDEGVYMEKVTQTIGTGSTTRTQEIQNFYVCKPLGNGMVQTQLLDMNDEALPIIERVDEIAFKRRFTFQPDYYKKKKSPQDMRVDRAIAQAEAHFNRKEYFSAEFEYDKALKIDEENVKANYGAGKTYLAMGETEKAKEKFEKLVKIDAILDEENKHIFNELGMELRRLGMHDQAIEHYKKALDFTHDDEHLFFNIARAYYEKGDLKTSRQYLRKALELNPKLGEAIRFYHQLK